MENKDKKPLKLSVVGKRGRHPHVDFTPTDSSEGPKKKFPIKEQRVVVHAKSRRTGRKVTRKFKDARAASEHYYKWLKKGKLRNVELASEALKQKAEKYDLPVEILAEIYDRGMKAWTEEIYNTVSVTQEQWAFARVNSFLEGGKALELDADLVTEAKQYKIHNKTSKTSLRKLSQRDDDIGQAARDEAARRENATYKTPKHAYRKLKDVMSGKSNLKYSHVNKLIKSLNLDPDSHLAKTLHARAKNNTSQALKTNASPWSKKNVKQWKKQGGLKPPVHHFPDGSQVRAKPDVTPVAATKGIVAKPMTSADASKKYHIAASSTVIAPEKKTVAKTAFNFFRRKKLGEALSPNTQLQNPAERLTQVTAVKTRLNKKHAIPAKYTGVAPTKPISEAAASALQSLATRQKQQKAQFNMKLAKEKMQARINQMQQNSQNKLKKVTK